MFKLWCVVFFVASLMSCGEQTQQADTPADTVLITNLLTVNDTLFESYRKQRSTDLLKTALSLFDTVLQNSGKYLYSKDSVILHKTALVFLYAGHYQNTLEDYVAADSLLHTYISLKQKLNKPENDWDAYTYKLLGDIYTRFGDYQVAKYYKQKSFAYYNTVQNQKEISSECINLTILYRELQQIDSALAYVGRGLSVKEIAPRRKWYLLIERARCLRLQKDTTGALVAWQQVKLFENSDTSLQSFAQYLAESKKEEAAQLSLEKNYLASAQALQLALHAALIHTNNRLNRDIGKIYILLGETYNQLKQSDSALTYINKALSCVLKKDEDSKFFVPATGDLYAENTIGDALQAKAIWMCTNAPKSEAAVPYLRCAVDCYERVNQVLFRLFASFSFDTSKLNLLAESKHRNEQAIEAAKKLHEITGDSKWLEKAFQFAEADKSYILAEALKRNLDNNINATGETYKKLQQARLNYAMLERNLFESIAGNDTSAIGRLKIKIGAADANLLALHKQWQLEHQSTSDWEEYHEVNMGKLYRKLTDQNATLLEYFTGVNRNYLFVLHPDKNIELVILSDSLIQTTTRFLSFFQNRHAITNNPQIFLGTAYDCYQQVAMGKAHTTNCVIVSDGLLSMLPFDALVTKAPVVNDLRSAHYLVKEKIIIHEFAGKTFLMERNNKSVSDIAVFAPTYSPSRNLMPLKAQNKEINQLKKIFSRHLIFNQDKATVSAFRSLKQASVLHLSAHAFANDSLPPRIELADSTLYLNEIYNSELIISLVVLSACETNRGYIQKTEGPLSLTKAFYYAGASQVIGNLWKADDATSADLLSRLYQSVKKELVSVSLTNAKRQYLSDSHAADKYSPYYWAGFILTGVGATATGGHAYAYIIIGLILLAYIALRFKTHTRKKN